MLLALLVSLSFVVLGVCLRQGKGAWFAAPLSTFAGFRQTPAGRRKLCRANAAVCFANAALLWTAAVCEGLAQSGYLPRQTVRVVAMAAAALLLLTIARAAWMLRHPAASSPNKQAKCDSPQRFSKRKL